MILKGSERHEAFGVKEFNNNNNNKRRTHHESNLFYVSNVSPTSAVSNEIEENAVILRGGGLVGH